MAISVLDTPTNPKKGGQDKLETSKYARALSAFMRECDTPLTIGVQGEWGSGKTSLLNLIDDDLRNFSRKKQGGFVDSGNDLFEIIWINTWEHSLLKSPEETLLSIISEITDHIVSVDGSWETAQKAKNLIGQLAKGAVRLGASTGLGVAGKQIAEEFMQGAATDNSVKALRASLDESVNRVLQSKNLKKERFIIFIDDLDRLDPTDAVKVMELLKNIFAIENCVFVVAIDYQVVVKGLREKFGEPNEDNEYEFRAFFDKIIQVPFMMPMGSYNINSYMETLLTEIGFLAKKSDFALIPSIVPIVQSSIGGNPRALKRLVNSLSLIKINWVGNDKPMPDGVKDEVIMLGVLLSLVCIQISFPKIFELLLKYEDFSAWNLDFVSKITKGENEEDEEMQSALAKVVQYNSPDFDEEWEQALFQIVWLNRWQRNRVVQCSRVLSHLKDGLLGTQYENDIESIISWGLEITAVTSVASLEDGGMVNTEAQEAAELQRNSAMFWDLVSSGLVGTKSLFEGSIRKNTRGWGLARKSKFSKDCWFEIGRHTGFFILFETRSGKSEMNYALASYIRSRATELESKVGAKIRIELKPGKNRQKIWLVCPEDVLSGDNDSACLDHEHLKLYVGSVCKAMPLFESNISELFRAFRELSSEDRERISHHLTEEKSDIAD